MDPETFTLRKKFLEEFLKETVKLINTNITISQNDFIDFNVMDYVDTLTFRTSIILNNFRFRNNDHLNIHVKEIYKLIKPFIYYLFSVTYKKKFLRGKPLLTEQIKIKYIFNVDGVITDVKMDLITDHYDLETLVDFSFLKYYNEKELSKSYVGNSAIINYLEIVLYTYYVFYNYDEYVSSVGELEERGEIVVTYPPSDSELANWQQRINERIANSQQSDSDDKNIINLSQTFKTDECVICLTNPPHVLYCNCGHLCICKECDKIKTLSSCPVCKTENKILRLIEQ